MNPSHGWLPIRRLFLHFGTEYEVLLTSKSHMAVSNWDDLVQKLSTVLEQNGIPNEIIEGRRSSEYTKCSLMADASIRQNRQAKQWGLELVSNVQAIFHENDDLWLQMYQQLWQCLEKDFEVLKSDSCGTHVHISLLDQNSQAGQRPAFPYLKRIAQALVHFERCIDSLMHAERRQNKFCRSNRYNALLRSLSVNKVVELIDEIKHELETPGGPDGYTVD